ncbi:Rad9 [Aureococcus anophagefferens]|nr:Rad9 [Aureococcus anophagefferens]
MRDSAAATREQDPPFATARRDGDIALAGHTFLPVPATGAPTYAVVAIVREPEQRLASGYHYVRSKEVLPPASAADPRTAGACAVNATCARINELARLASAASASTHRNWCTSDSHAGIQTRYLCGYDDPLRGARRRLPGHRERQRDRAPHDPAERIDDGGYRALALLPAAPASNGGGAVEARYGGVYDSRRAPVARDPEVPWVVADSADEIDALAELCGDDQRVYDFAARLFDGRLRACDARYAPTASGQPKMASTPLFAFEISAQHIRTFSAAVTALSAVGKEICLGVSRARSGDQAYLTLSAYDDAATSFGSFRFEERFFAGADAAPGYGAGDRRQDPRADALPRAEAGDGALPRRREHGHAPPRCRRSSATPRAAMSFAVAVGELRVSSTADDAEANDGELATELKISSTDFESPLPEDRGGGDDAASIAFQIKQAKAMVRFCDSADAGRDQVPPAGPSRSRAANGCDCRFIISRRASGAPRLCMMGAGGSAAHQRADGPPPPGTDPVFDKMVEDELARRKDQGGAAKPGASAPPVPGEDPVFDAMVKQEMERQKYEVDAFAGALGARDGRGPARAEPSLSPRAALAEGGAGAMARLERDMRAERDAYGGQGYGRAPEPARAALLRRRGRPYGADGGQPWRPARQAAPVRRGAAPADGGAAADLRGGDDDWQRARRAPPPREPRGYGTLRRAPGLRWRRAAHGPPPWAHGDDAQAAYAELEAQMREKADRDRFHRNRDMAASRSGSGYPPSPTRDDGGASAAEPTARAAAAGAYGGGAPQEPTAAARRRSLRRRGAAGSLRRRAAAAEDARGTAVLEEDERARRGARAPLRAARAASSSSSRSRSPPPTARASRRREAKEAEAAERRRQEAADLEEERRRDAEEKAKKDEEDRQQPRRRGRGARRRRRGSRRRRSSARPRPSPRTTGSARRSGPASLRTGAAAARKATNRYDDERVRDSELDKAADDFERRVAAELERFQLDRERREGRKEVARREPPAPPRRRRQVRARRDQASIYDLAGVEPPAPVKDRDVRPPPEDWAEKSLAGNSSFVPLPADYKASAEFDGLNPAAREPEMNQVDEYLSPDAIADRWQRDHPVVADPAARRCEPHPASSDRQGRASTAKFTGAAEQSSSGRAPGTKDRARWSDESPFLPGGPPPPGTDPVFDRMVEAELANRVNTPRADGDPPADFFK